MNNADDIDDLHTNARVFESVLRTYKVPTKTGVELQTEPCCDDYCHLRLSGLVIAQFRGGIMESVGRNACSPRLKEVIYSVLRSRTDTSIRSGIKDLASLYIDTEVYGVTLCRKKFYQLLGITGPMYHAWLERIAHRLPFLHNRSGDSGKLSDNVTRAIARIAAYTSIHGQFNPMESGDLMLGRSVSTNNFLRTNATEGRLTRKMLREYVAIGLKRRGADAFMHCDTCKILGEEWKQMSNILRVASREGDGRPRIRRGGYTAEACRNRLKSRRKAVLDAHCAPLYNAKRAELAKARKVSEDDIPADDIVPDAHTEVDKYCELLNQRVNVRGNYPTLKNFTITPNDVRVEEIASFEDDAIELYINGELDVDDLTRPLCTDDEPVIRRPVHEAEDEEVPDAVVLDDGEGDSIPVADLADKPEVVEEPPRALQDFNALVSGMDSHDPVKRRKAVLLTAAERIVRLRGFHNSHVTAERIMCYSAFEAGAMNPTSFLVLAADGMSKDRTKLPRKFEKGKEDATVKRLDCFVTCLQVAVPGMRDNGLFDKTRIGAEGRRRAELMMKIEKASKRPSEELLREIEDGQKETAERDAASSSSFSFVNHDFIYPFAWGGTPKADGLVSNTLHVLRSVPIVPPVVAIIVDNASSNKSIHCLRAFGLILELIPTIQEVHLLFATVGHTHNSVDAHFGALTAAMKKVDLGTPTDLAECFETVKNTKCHLDFDLYEFANGLEDYGGYSFKWIGHQHHFLLFRDHAGDVKFDNKSFLRFAEPLSNRVTSVLSATRSFIPRSDIENRMEGVYLYEPGEDERMRRVAYAKTIFPTERDAKFFAGPHVRLERLLKSSGMESEKRSKDLASLYDGHHTPGPSLFDVCKMINEKNPRVDFSSELGIQQEIAIAQHIRLRDRSFKYNHLQLELCKISKENIVKFARELFKILGHGEADNDLAMKVHKKIADVGGPMTLKKISAVMDEMNAKFAADANKAGSRRRLVAAEPLIDETRYAGDDQMPDLSLQGSPLASDDSDDDMMMNPGAMPPARKRRVEEYEEPENEYEEIDGPAPPLRRGGRKRVKKLMHTPPSP